MWFLELFPRFLILILITLLAARVLFVFRPFIEKGLRQFFNFIHQTRYENELRRKKRKNNTR